MKGKNATTDFKKFQVSIIAQKNIFTQIETF
jgi:hypothetical protein